LVFTAIFLLFLVPFSFASLSVALSDQGNGVRNKATNTSLSLGNLSVSIYDAPSGGNLIYSETFSGAIKNGSWNVMLGEDGANPLLLSFGSAYYKAYSINGEAAAFTNNSGGVVSRQLFYSPLGDINTSVLADGSITQAKLANSINLTNATGYQWANIVGVPANISNGSGGTTYVYALNISGSTYLLNSSGIADINESRLNATIDSRALLVRVSGDNVYILNGSILSLNESRLNSTIDARAAGSAIWSNDSSKVFISAGYPQNLTLNGNLWTQSLIFPFGESFDNLVLGWMRLSGSLNITGNLNAQDISVRNISANDISARDISARNITAAYFIGDGSQLSNVNVTIAPGSINGSAIVDGTINPTKLNNSASFTVSGLNVTGTATLSILAIDTLSPNSASSITATAQINAPAFNASDNVTIGSATMYVNGTEFVIDY